MRKNLRYFFVLTCGFACSIANVFAQTPASVTWSLLTDQTSTVSGDVNASEQVLSNLVIKNYGAIAVSTVGYNNGLAVTAQRILPDAGTGWPNNESGRLLTRYAEYEVKPNTGSDFKVTTVSFDFGDAGSTSLMKADIYYSRDNFTTEAIKLNTEEAGIVLPKFSNEERWMQAKYNGVSILVPNGGNLKVRVYPWWPSGSSATKYLVQSNVSISGVTGAPGTLPLDFLSFTAKTDLISKSVNLQWQTTNEKNTKEFVVERKTGANDFEAIGTVNSKNIDGVHTYAFVDAKAANGDNYYRLKQVDLDGAFTYSNIISAKSESAKLLAVYPNPTANELNVNLTGVSTESTLQVVNSLGQAVIVQKVAAGQTNIVLNVSKLNKGVYTLIQQSSLGQQSTKFVKN